MSYSENFNQQSTLSAQTGTGKSPGVVMGHSAGVLGCWTSRGWVSLRANGLLLGKKDEGKPLALFGRGYSHILSLLSRPTACCINSAGARDV